MAFAFQSKTWVISGEKEFESGTKLLNPSLSVNQVVVNDNGLYVSLKATENGGVYIHNVNVAYPFLTEETDLDVLVDAAMAHAFPTATVA